MTPEEIAAAEAAKAAQDAADAAKAKAEADAKAEAKTYDEAYVKGLRSEAAGYRTKLKEFETAEEARKQAEMTEAQKLVARAEAAEQRAKELEIQSVRSRAAAKHAIPEDLHEFITATDEAGALAQAAKLAEKLKGAGAGGALPGSGGRNPANGGEAAKKLDEKERFEAIRQKVPALNGRILRA